MLYGHNTESSIYEFNYFTAGNNYTKTYYPYAPARGTGCTNAGKVLPPLMGRQYELGGKTRLGGALYTLAYFRIDQSSQFSNNASPTPTYVQDGRQYNQGVEFTTSGKITRDLTLFGGATHLSPVLKKQSPANAVLVGKDPVGIARSSAKAYAEYHLPFATKCFVTGGVYYTGRVHKSTANTLTLPSFTTVDLGVRYESRVGALPLVFRVNVTNVANKAYWLMDSFQGQAFLGAPITPGPR